MTSPGKIAVSKQGVLVMKGFFSAKVATFEENIALCANFIRKFVLDTS